ncbi:Uma2 family endonuclease [Nonomuraea rhizosphaerae]|uniref:Uma2 family endonuclease n=1 Tax=Nonomuraea rhizosphaerae TaxID=2665663 RepID=UPI001C5E8D02|nr:Uma2 family endonuclease [Nonomuraea rhizosphaerae]
MEPPSSLPAWVFPPPEGFEAQDLDHIPDLPAHTELIDGSLVFVSPQLVFHAQAIDLLRMALKRCAPKEFKVRREVSVILEAGQRPEPDLSVVKADAAHGDLSKTYYEAGDVVLVVEVVSPESRIRDRVRKPQLYAAAGIPHFWRVERDTHGPVVYVYELDPATGSYVPTGIHRDKLKLALPFDIDADIDLASIEDF